MSRMRMRDRRRVRVSSFVCLTSFGLYDLVVTVPSFLISEAPSRGLSSAPSTSPPPPEETPVASSSKATSRRSKAEAKESKPTIKAKGKTKTKTKAKAKVAAAVEGEDVEMHDGDKEAAGAKESDPPEEDNDSGEEELEERKAASKRCVFKFLYFHCSVLLPAFQSMLYAELSFHSAQVALDRRDEMDVEGWKVGDPYVQSLSIGCCVADILLVYPMLRSQRHLHSSRRLRSG
jgi:hypothetical protein